VTTPPPAADTGAAPGDSSGAGPAAAPEGPPPSVGGAPPSGPAYGDGLFAYPKNGQTDAQQTSDRSECAQWAGAQTGQTASNTMDYRRAMTACLQGRGYSVN
jgi:hypothetical protein